MAPDYSVLDEIRRFLFKTPIRKIRRTCDCNLPDETISSTVASGSAGKAEEWPFPMLAMLNLSILQPASPFRRVSSAPL